MAALVEGQKYGLSSKGHIHDNKTKVFVKLTDSALRAIEEYLRVRNTANKHPSIQFIRNQGVITFPNTQNPGEAHSFNFTLSSAADIEGPQGSYECVQQCGNRSIESLGSLQYKMQIHAKEDVYDMTKTKMAAAEEENKKNCTKVIKANCSYFGRKVKVKKNNMVIPPKPTSPSYGKHSSSSSVSLVSGPSGMMAGSNGSGNNLRPNGMSNGHAASVVAGGGVAHTNGFHSNPHAKPPAPKSGNPEIMKKSYRERIIHLLALRPYKKPELLARLMKDGIKEKDKKSLSSILSQVASLKENVYTLGKHACSEVQEEWPFYSESDRQLLKRTLAKYSTPPGDESPSSSQICSATTTVTTATLAQKRTNEEPSPIAPKKQRISHYHKPEVFSGYQRSDAPQAKDAADSFHQNGVGFSSSRNSGGGGGGEGGTYGLAVSRTDGAGSNGSFQSKSRKEVHGCSDSQSRPDGQPGGGGGSGHAAHHSNGVGGVGSHRSSNATNSRLANHHSSAPVHPRERLPPPDISVSSPEHADGNDRGLSSGKVNGHNGFVHRNGSNGAHGYDSSTNGTHRPLNGGLRSRPGEEPVTFGSSHLLNKSPNLTNGSAVHSVNGLGHNHRPNGSNHSLTNGNGNGDYANGSGDESEMTETSKLDDAEYKRKYTLITSAEQRALYKADFNAEYSEYRDLHTLVDCVSKRFCSLKESLKSAESGSPEWLKLRDQIVREYKDNKRDRKYQDVKRKFQYLHEKLAHIKRLVIEYDEENDENEDLMA